MCAWIPLGRGNRKYLLRKLGALGEERLEEEEGEGRRKGQGERKEWDGLDEGRTEMENNE